MKIRFLMMIDLAILLFSSCLFCLLLFHTNIVLAVFSALFFLISIFIYMLIIKQLGLNKNVSIIDACHFYLVCKKEGIDTSTLATNRKKNKLSKNTSTFAYFDSIQEDEYIKLYIIGKKIVEGEKNDI